jgi:hypothetical protein
MQNIKTGGAASHGLALDTYAARMLARDGQLEAEMPVGEAAKVITKGLAQDALLARLHALCAAEAYVAAIAREIVTNGGPILIAANDIFGGSIKELEFEMLQRFYARLVNDTSLFRGVDIEAASMERNDAHPAIVRSRLAHADHKAKTLRVNTTPDTWYDAAAAYANGDPSYGYDRWAMLGVAGKIDTILPHNNMGGFAVASAVRLAATSRLLPRDEHSKGVDIVIH